MATSTTNKKIMPDNNNSAYYAAAAASAAAGLDAAATARLNKKQRQFAIDMWNMQNAYNTPQMQMQRFKDAGLNPNLIYGQGNSGNAGAVSTPEFKVPEWGQALSAAVPAGLSALNQMYDFDIKEQQKDNLEAQNAVILQEARLKAAQVVQTLTNTDRQKFDLDFERSLASVSADARRAALHNLQVNTDLSIRKDLREAVQTAANVTEAVERTKNLLVQRNNLRIQQTKDRAEIERIQADTRRIKATVQILHEEGLIKEIHRKMWDDGISPNDPQWSRLLSIQLEKWFNDNTPSPSGPLMDGLKDGLKQSILSIFK